MWQYRILTNLLAPLALFYSVWYAFKHQDFQYLLNRFAVNLPGFTKQVIWIHAASVGEVNACQSLVAELQKLLPGYEIVISTNTVTGKNHVTQIHGDNVRHIYLPFDIFFITRHALKKIQPDYVFIIETEIWPNLYTCCKSKNIPLLMINARLSEKTLSTFDWLKNAYAHAVQATTLILSRSETDTTRYITLGANKNNIKTLGNIKYSVQNRPQLTKINIPQEFILAASTREQEERIVVQAWQQATTQFMLVIALRHPHRLKAVLDDLSEFSLNISVRSRNDKVTDKTDIYIVDTLGELDSFISQSEFVIMCGSFVEKGGHNFIEVARARKAIVFGSSMFNFTDEARDFLQHNAAIQDNSIEALSATISELSQNKAKRDTLADNAALQLKAYENILASYVDAIRQVVRP